MDEGGYGAHRFSAAGDVARSMTRTKTQDHPAAPARPAGLLTALADRSLIALSGGQARDFLQRILTQDMAKVVPGRAVPAALLTPQGKLQHLLLLTALADGRILIETGREEASDLLRLLTLYRLRADVAFTPMAHGVVFAADPATMGRAGLHDEEDGAVVVAEDARAPGRLMRFYALADRSELASGLARSVEALAAYARVRAEEGIAEGPVELPPGRLFALEANLDCIDAVSFTKGCYVGQEVTTRSYRRGRVKKRLLPFFVDAQDEGPAAGEKVARADDGVVIGEVIAPARHGVGWALCRIAALVEQAERERLACTAQGRAVTLHLPLRLRAVLDGEAAGAKRGEERG